MDILGYIGFAILVFMAVTWTIGVRVKLETGIHTIMGALFFLVSALFVGLSGISKLHSWWIVPSGFIFMMLVSVVALRIPVLSHLMRITASFFAAIVRIGIPAARIKAVQRGCHRS